MWTILYDLLYITSVGLRESDREDSTSVCTLPTAIQISLSWVVGELVADIRCLLGEPVDSIRYPPYIWLNSRDQVGVFT